MTEAEAGSKPESEIGPPDDGTTRLLIVAAHEIVGDELIRALEDRLRNERTEARIVAPALASSALKHVAGDVDEGREEAEERLRHSTERLSRDGFAVSGMVGDADPLLAIEDGLAQFPADEILLVTANDGAHWLEPDLFERARQRFAQPVVHVELEQRGGGETRVADWERSDPGAKPPADAEVDTRSENMPRFSVRDLTGIVVAVVGSIAAILIATGCDDGETIQRATAEAGEGTDGSCVAAYVVAGITTLVNIAHVVGLVLFESVGYRGGWARFFGWLSLAGTPVAVLAIALLAH